MACWGWRTGQKWHRLGFDVLVLERGYIGDRFAWTSLAWNGLNGRGEAPVIDDGGARFRQYHGHLKEWNAEGDYVLICGQVPGDASLQGVDLNPWYKSKVEEYTGERIVFRPHPSGASQGAVQELLGCEKSSGSLEDDLAGAKLVVTYNSNAGVDAMLAGKPATCENEGSMIWGVHPMDRQNWANRLAWRQWLIEEIESGFALGVLCGR